MIDKIIKATVKFLDEKIERKEFKEQINKLIKNNEKKLYSEDEEVADLITNELFEIANKKDLSDEDFLDEIKSILDEIKTIIEI